MEEKRETEETQEQGYVPRPKWQIALAWMGVVLMILFVIYQLLAIMGVAVYCGFCELIRATASPASA